MPAHLSDRWRHLAAAAGVLLALGAAAGAQRVAPPRNIWTDHLKVRPSTSAPAVAPGGRVSLQVEITPGERIHVYAPGADNYRVITLTVPPQAGLAPVAPVRYPASEIYHFVPLDERVPVYQKPFTLAQEVTLREAPGGSRAGAPLQVRGTLDYQACDDRVCFKPVSVPVTWTVTVSAPAAPRGN